MTGRTLIAAGVLLVVAATTLALVDARPPQARREVAAIEDAGPMVMDAAVDAGRDGGDGGGWDDTATFASVHPSVQEKIVALRDKMAKLGRRVYLTDGARAGSAAASMHNQALAIDVDIDYMASPEVAAELRAVGFPCAIPYFDAKWQPCHMAHGDLRNTPLARGPYAPGGSKAEDCPAAAASRTGSCDNSVKAQWSYFKTAPPEVAAWLAPRAAPAPARDAGTASSARMPDGGARANAP